MSRNKQQGKYAGKLQGKHYRTRSKSVSTCVHDCHIELFMRDGRKTQRVVQDAFLCWLVSYVRS